MQGLMLALGRWTRSSITVTIAGSAEVWTPAEDVATVSEAAAALVVWILDGARAWAASVAACTSALVEVGDGHAVQVDLTEIVTLHVGLTGTSSYYALGVTLTAAVPITITGVRFRTAATATRTIRTYTRAGSVVGTMASSAGWTLRDEQSKAIATGIIEVTLAVPVTLAAGVHGLYITNPTNGVGGLVRYVAGAPTSYADANLTITTHGVGDSNFDNEFANFRADVGVVYTVLTGAPATSAPTGRWATYLPALDGSAVCLGTFALPVNTYGWSRHDKAPGGITGAGSAWANGATRYAPRRPALSVVLEPAQAARLELATQYTPQLGTYLLVYDPHAAAWRRLTYGALTVEGTADLHTATFEALGAPTS